jgi:hypothetical protein
MACCRLHDSGGTANGLTYYAMWEHAVYVQASLQYLRGNVELNALDRAAAL